MRLLSDTTADPALADTERDKRIEEFEAAYAVFTEEDGGGVTSATGSNEQGTKRLLGLPTWLWIVVVIGLIITAVVIFASAGGGTGQDSPSQSATEVPSQPATTRPTPVETPSADTGSSGLVGSCWRDVVGASPDANGTVSIEKVDCTNSTAQWRVYKEATSPSNCQQDYLTTQDGVTLCLRAV